MERQPFESPFEDEKDAELFEVPGQEDRNDVKIGEEKYKSEEEKWGYEKLLREAKKISGLFVEKKSNLTDEEEKSARQKMIEDVEEFLDQPGNEELNREEVRARWEVMSEEERDQAIRESKKEEDAA